MRVQRFLCWLIALSLLLIFGFGAFHRPGSARAAPLSQASAYELILAMNTLRVSYGLPALIEDPIVNAVAQSTAQIMAANNMSWHIGDVRGRIAAAGYGGGGTVDNGGQAITISEPLLAPTGDGVSATGLTVSGGGYQDTPLVTITGGGGTGENAVDGVDGASTAAGLAVSGSRGLPAKSAAASSAEGGAPSGCRRRVSTLIRRS